MHFMKILWPCHWFGDYRVPVFKHLNTLCENKLMLFYSQEDVTQSVDTKMKKYLPNSSEGLKGHTFIIGKRNKTTFANTQLYIRLHFGLYRKIRKFKPDIIIAETFGGWTPIALIYSIIHKKKLLLFYERTAYVERNASKWRILYRKLIGRFVSCFLINGQLTREYLDSLGFKDTIKIEGLMVSDTDGLRADINNMQHEDKNKLRKELHIKESSITYLFIGQIVERKGINQLTTAWLKHIETYSNDKLLIIGQGALLDNLKIQYAKLKSLIFLGNIAYDNIYKYYAISDVFIMPTLEDNWCLVVPEAMACSLPVACSIYNGGHIELISNGKNGYTFDPLQEESILKTLEKFHYSNLTEMGRYSQNIVKNYTPEIASKKIHNACVEIYNKTNCKK